MGPIEAVMKNSKTVGEAFRFCSEHINVYSNATQFNLQTQLRQDSIFAGFEILLDNVGEHQQAVEHAVMATHLLALDVSNNKTHSQEVWFKDFPLSSPDIYRKHFGCRVLFGQKFNGIFLRKIDLDQHIANPDQQIYEMATSYIEARFPSTPTSLTHQIKLLILHSLDSGHCTASILADRFGITARTLQRHLKREGTSFEEIKNSVRKDIALRCLKRPDIPLNRITEILGYSEISVFTRSCHRWFGMSPRELRLYLIHGDRTLIN